jgi:type IV pilus assembly protein PilM
VLPPAAADPDSPVVPGVPPALPHATELAPPPPSAVEPVPPSTPYVPVTPHAAELAPSPPVVEPVQPVDPVVHVSAATPPATLRPTDVPAWLGGPESPAEADPPVEPTEPAEDTPSAEPTPPAAAADDPFSVPPVAPDAPADPEPELEPTPAAVAFSTPDPAQQEPGQPEEPAKAGKAERGRKAEKGKRHATTRVVGLRIGSTQLAAAHIANNGKAELVQLAQAPIERGLVIGGEVRDADGLARELKQFFAANKLPRKGIRLGIASNRIGVRILDVPTVEDEKQFENAIRFRAQELLPIPVTDAILDHVRLAETTGENDEPLTTVLLVFAHRELVGRYVDACRNAGLRLSGIDLEAFALLRALAAPRDVNEEPKHAIVAVAIGHDRTVLAVSDGRVCSLTRVLEWGSAQLDVAIARTLDLTPSQAEPIKLELSLTGSEPPEGISLVQLEAVRSAVTAEIGVLGRELVSSLRFYQSRPDSLAIGEVLLSGGGSQLDGFAEELHGLLGAPVRPADPFARVEPARKLALPEQAGSFAIAVGLGIED